MSCDDFVEYMTFECGVDVRLVLPRTHTFSNMNLAEWFDQTEDWHNRLCRKCKESKDVRSDTT